MDKNIVPVIRYSFLLLSSFMLSRSTERDEGSGNDICCDATKINDSLFLFVQSAHGYAHTHKGGRNEG